MTCFFEPALYHYFTMIHYHNNNALATNGIAYRWAMQKLVQLFQSIRSHQLRVYYSCVFTREYVYIHYIYIYYILYCYICTYSILYIYIFILYYIYLFYTIYMYIYILYYLWIAGTCMRIVNERGSAGLPESEVFKIFCDICEAVSRLHHCQTPILHRDLKVRDAN